jgi:hypothetical protein
MNKLFVLSMIATEVATAMLMSISIIFFLIPFLPKLSAFDTWQRCLFCGSIGSGAALMLAMMGSGILEIAKEFHSLHGS